MKAKGQLKCCSAGTVHRATGRKGQCDRPEPNRVRAGVFCAVSLLGLLRILLHRGDQSECRGLSLLQEFFICGFASAIRWVLSPRGAVCEAAGRGATKGPGGEFLSVFRCFFLV